MPCLLYCVTQQEEVVPVASGVCDAVVQSQEVIGLRVYWSEIADPEACLGAPESLKQAAAQSQRVLREVLAATTPIPFPFPTLLESADELERYLAPAAEAYGATLARLRNAVQYEIVATWVADEEADLAKPVTGREYRKRREETAARIAALDHKLRTVTDDSVSKWRDRQDRRMHRWFALVPRECRERFLASLRSASPSEGVRLRLSGPWPPSEFITRPD